MEVNIVVPNYLRSIKLSNKRKEIFYVVNGVSIIGENGKSLPSKYLDYTDIENGSAPKLKKEYGIIEHKRGKKVLRIIAEMSTMKPVLANPKAAGTPNYMAINGQALYNGKVATFTRAKMMAEIKRSFIAPIMEVYDELNELFYTYEKFELNTILYDEIGIGNWDLQNRIFPYEKAILDILVTGKIDATTKVMIPILQDDSIQYITKFSSEFVEAEPPTIIFQFKPIL